MTSILSNVRSLAADLPAHQLANLDEVELVQIQHGALDEVAGYLETKRWTSVVMVVDGNTYDQAGQRLSNLLSKSSIRVQVTRLLPDRKGDVIADEVSLIQVILDIQHSGAKAVLAVGGGTIHDISRYAAYTAGVPFISIPTAASVDGFNSKGAPIIIRGEKITIPAIGPSAIFADVDILMAAPSQLTAAGFGDMLGKYTSLFDWKFGSLVADEPYLQISADMTKSALSQCVNAVEQIAKRSEEGVRILMGALVESGLAMLLFGQSHPASGSEHHLSHYWEMEFIRLGKKQLLHGSKVGAACVEISKLYHRIGEQGIELNGGAYPASEDIKRRMALQWDDIRSHITQLPEPEVLGDLMRMVGGPAGVSELPIGDELLERSLAEAHKVRYSRYTLLHAYNEHPSLFVK
ncbi:sn-glycerol-1-phosphate dehydrogenase [Cytobacillus firmus]|jgi:glycerol-1-phosphate dehydrogenase [NAD(P)+]|uniref:sn-glycerol-1-phosphate dehydrogenase n=1 Tax=Paenibacillus lautus TaxID=1401 RepID=UPI0026F3422E|nr:sn-glycerol-1-phosphate dehydrogenase [Paenibacillus lautus]MBY0164698.1 sn-glycerol-1-phosphate dehydrogenase [Cytobacillus firmus]MCI1772438.1 sn-glycerol-1-phosphate dehydrogenase [Paenibacillus lautus]